LKLFDAFLEKAQKKYCWKNGRAYLPNTPLIKNILNHPNTTLLKKD